MVLLVHVMMLYMHMSGLNCRICLYLIPKWCSYMYMYMYMCLCGAYHTYM